jgi:hypothetical protein
MPELSPAAQAVWDAYELVDCDEFRIDPRRAGLAAALVAAADQGTQLLAIAAELRGQGGSNG